jgi:hypothetical protein
VLTLYLALMRSITILEKSILVMFRKPALYCRGEGDTVVRTHSRAVAAFNPADHVDAERRVAAANLQTTKYDPPQLIQAPRRRAQGPRTIKMRSDGRTYLASNSATFS